MRVFIVQFVHVRLASCCSSLSLCPDYDAVLSQFDPNLARIVFSYLPNKPEPYDPTYMDSRIEYAKLVWYANFPRSKSYSTRWVFEKD